MISVTLASPSQTARSSSTSSVASTSVSLPSAFTFAATALPTFLQVRNDLQLEELNMANTTPTTTLYSSTTGAAKSSSPTPPPLAPTPPQQPSSGSRGGAPKKTKRGKCAGRNTQGGVTNQGGSVQSSPGPGHPPPVGWPLYYNPWSGSIHMWPQPGPRAPGASYRPPLPAQ